MLKIKLVFISDRRDILQWWAIFRIICNSENVNKSLIVDYGNEYTTHAPLCKYDAQPSMHQLGNFEKIVKRFALLVD